MLSSWIGRLLIALPGLLASVAVGLVVAGWTGALLPAAVVSGVLAALVTIRAAATGIVIDLDRRAIVLRTFWRSHELSAHALVRVETTSSGDLGIPGVRFVTRDGRQVSSSVLCYLDERRADAFITQLTAMGDEHLTVALDADSFRPTSS